MKNSLLGIFLLFGVACQSGEHLSGAPASPEAGDVLASKDYTLGIEECDSYLKMYQECLASKIPESQKPAFKVSLDQTLALWQQAFFDEQKRSKLAQACTETTTITQKIFTSYGCN